MLSQKRLPEEVIKKWQDRWCNKQARVQAMAIPNQTSKPIELAISILLQPKLKPLKAMMGYSEQSLQIQHVTGLQPKHFADLMRTAQLVADPAAGLSGRAVAVNWEAFDVPPGVVANLQTLGAQYRYASPYLAIDVIWEQLTPETRSWFIENKNELWRIEEIFPALDED